MRSLPVLLCFIACQVADCALDLCGSCNTECSYGISITHNSQPEYYYRTVHYRTCLSGACSAETNDGEMFIYQAYDGTSFLASAMNVYLWFDCTTGRWTRSVVPTSWSSCPDRFSCAPPYPSGVDVGPSWAVCPYDGGPTCTVPHDHSPHGHNPHAHSPHGHNPHDHSPHGHNPHNHRPHNHSPHTHHPHSPHDHSPHDHSPDTNTFSSSAPTGDCTCDELVAFVRGGTGTQLCTEARADCTNSPGANFRWQCTMSSTNGVTEYEVECDQSSSGSGGTNDASSLSVPELCYDGPDPDVGYDCPITYSCGKGQCIPPTYSLCEDGPATGPDYQCAPTQSCGRGECVPATFTLCGTSGTTMCAATETCCGITVETKDTDMVCNELMDTCPLEQRSDTTYRSPAYISPAKRAGSANLSTEDDEDSMGPIIGAAVGGVVVIGAIVLGVVRMKKLKAKDPNQVVSVTVNTVNSVQMTSSTDSDKAQETNTMDAQDKI